MAATRSAHTVWEGNLIKGSGVVTFDSSGSIGEQPVTWASRAEEANGKTSPEELIAAAHSSAARWPSPTSSTRPATRRPAW